jgi:hypothetical protein
MPAVRWELIVAKWLGAVFVSLVMGMAMTVLVQLALPSMSFGLRVTLSLAVAALVAPALIAAVRISSSMETHHGKQFE